MQARLARLQEERQALLARREALEQWVAAVEEFADVTAPLRAAAAARAQGDAAGRLRLQDAALAALLDRFGALGRGGCSGGGGSSGAGGSSSNSGDGNGSSGSSSGGGGSSGGGSSGGGSSGGGSSGSGDGGCTVAATARLPWAAPLANAAAAEARLLECEAETAQGLAARIRGSVQALALHLQQMRGAPSPATPAAAARLTDDLSSLVCRFALATFVSPCAAFGACTLRLDTLQAVNEEPPPAFWDHCVEQARTTPQQDRAAAALLAKWLEATGAAMARRAHLVRAAFRLSVAGSECAAEAGPEEILRAVEARNAEIVVATVTAALALLGRILSAEQAAALLVSAYPYVPTFSVLERQLRKKTGRVSAADAVAAAAPIKDGGGDDSGGGAP